LILNLSVFSNNYFKQIKSTFCFVVLSFFAINTLVAQDISKFRQDGLRLFERKKYMAASSLLETYNEKKPNDVEIIKALFTSYYELGKLELSRALLAQYFEIEKNIDPSAILISARLAHAQSRYKDAIKFYKNYLRITKEPENVRFSIANDIKRCANGLILERQPERALVENFGDKVNSNFNETAPLQSPTDEDKMYFASDRPNSTGGLRNNEGIEDLYEGHYFYDIYSTAIENSDYLMPIKLENNLINTARNELPISIIGKGRNFIFFRSLNMFSGDFLVDSFKNDNEVRSLPPRIDAPIKSETGDNSLFYANDSLIIFCSRNDSGFGGLDLYYTVRSNNVWSKPTNMGSEINSPFDETTPFLCNDGRTLYFSSNSTASIGGFDVFKSVFNEKLQKWSALENVGKPINSAGDDVYFKLQNDGYKGYLASNRKEGFGEFDLYNVVFKKLLPEVTTSNNKPFYDVLSQTDSSQLALEDPTQKILNYTLTSLMYNGDDEVLNTTNITKLRDVLSITKNDPSSHIILTLHGLQGEKTSLDLYFGIKKVEKVAKFLIDNGVKSEYILAKSVGSEFPIAKTVLDDGKPNTSGEKLNQRIDIGFFGIDTAKIKITVEKPVVSEFMVNPIGKTFFKHSDSLSYKIQVNASKRLFDNDILEKIGGAMIESVGVEGFYQYTVGLYRKFSDANAALQKIKATIPDATIIPYLKGYRIQGDTAKKFIKNYPDLKNYVK